MLESVTTIKAEGHRCCWEVQLPPYGARKNNNNLETSEWWGATTSPDKE